MYQLRRFSEDVNSYRTWGNFVGPRNRSRSELMGIARRMIDGYCEGHPGNAFYRTEPLECVAENRDVPGVEFGLSIREAHE